MIVVAQFKVLIERTTVAFCRVIHGKRVKAYRSFAGEDKSSTLAGAEWTALPKG